MRRNNLPTIIFICCCMFLFSCGKSSKPMDQSVDKVKDYLTETKEDRDARMEWWKDARFGMFIHWGLYAVPAGEYNGKTTSGCGEWIMNDDSIPVSEYEKYAAQFNPTQYDPAQWVKMAKDAGMKYIVITSKHHDGFCLWDTKVGDYNVMQATPYKKDILKALSDECKKQGIRLCFYYSIMDWHHPEANPKNINNTPEERMANFPKYRDSYMKPQLAELLTNYDNIGVLWFDGEWIDEWTEPQARDLYNYLRNIKPDLIINNRISKGRNGYQGMSSTEYCGDFGTPEQEIHDGKSEMSWETCMTMNDTWGYKKSDNHWKSSEALIQQLIDAVSKGGNYLLNVGPTAEGLIPEASVERLKDMGDWMKINSEAIYATHPMEQYKDGDNIRFTQSKDGKNTYIFSFVWPGKSLTTKLVKPESNAKITLLGYDEPLKWKYDDQKGLTITLPQDAKDKFNKAQSIAYTFKIKNG